MVYQNDYQVDGVFLQSIAIVQKIHILEDPSSKYGLRQLSHWEKANPSGGEMTRS